MAEIVRMPKMSDTMTEGVLVKWHKKVGDKVKIGELMAEIETDKATMEFESYFDGILLNIGIEEGKAAPVDSILAYKHLYIIQMDQDMENLQQTLHYHQQYLLLFY